MTVTYCYTKHFSESIIFWGEGDGRDFLVESLLIN